MNFKPKKKLRKPCARCEVYFQPSGSVTKICDKCYNSAMKQRRGMGIKK